MLIDTDFPDHDKTQDLIDALDDKDATRYLLRIWARCQLRKTDVLKDDPKKLAGCCKYPGDPKKLYDAMIKVEWLELCSAGLRAVGFMEHQSSMTSKWRNGDLGGRPKKPKSNSVTTQKPKSNSVPTQKSKSNSVSSSPQNDLKKTEIKFGSLKERKIEGKIEGKKDCVDAGARENGGGSRYDELKQRWEFHRFEDIDALRHFDYETFVRVIRGWWDTLSMKDIDSVCATAARSGAIWSGTIDQPGHWFEGKFRSYRDQTDKDDQKEEAMEAASRQLGDF